jgi:MFS family permease
MSDARGVGVPSAEPPTQPPPRDAAEEEAQTLLSVEEAQSLLSDEPSPDVLLRLPSARVCCLPVADLPFWYGWVILALCTLARFLKSYGQNNTLFISVPGILVEVNMTRTALGVWFSVACVLAAAVQPLFGRLHDRFGGRLCIPVALLALAVSLFALAAAQTPAGVFVALIGLRSVGLGALDTFTSNTVTLWFVKRRGLALAFSTIGFYLGTDLLTLQLLAAVAGPGGLRWRGALCAAAGTCIACAPVCALLLRSHPEHAGLRPDGFATATSQQGDDVPLSAAATVVPDLTRGEALRTPQFWVWGLFTLVYFFGASGTDFHLIPMVREAGTVSVSSTLSIATGVSSGICCVLVGYIMDRGASGVRVLACAGVLLGCYVLMLTVCSSALLAWITGGVKGGADACASIALPYLHAQRFGKRHGGAIFASNRTMGVVGSGLGPLLFGVARDRGHAFAPALRGVALMPVLCAAACVLTAPQLGRSGALWPADAARRDAELAERPAAADAIER